MPFNKLHSYKDSQIDEEFRRLIQELALQPAWIAPTLQNSWVNYNAAIHVPAGYFKDQFGFVHLRGTVKNGTIPGVMFTLPVGYRPVLRTILMTIANGAIAELYIDPDGTVNIATGSNVYFSISGISFRTV